MQELRETLPYGKERETSDGFGSSEDKSVLRDFAIQVKEERNLGNKQYQERGGISEK